jgi:hypothetical protein
MLLTHLRLAFERDQSQLVLVRTASIRDLEAQFVVNYRAKDADKLVSSYHADEASNLFEFAPESKISCRPVPTYLFP